MAASTDTRQFAVEQVDRLLGRLVFQISRILRPHDGNSVRDLRIAIRRFSRALLVFGPCFPAKDVKKIRRRLEEMMAPARELRDCDLALNLLSGSKRLELIALGRQRKDAQRVLVIMLRRWMERNSSLKWRTRLQTTNGAAKETLPGSAEEAAAEMLPVLARDFFDRGSQAVDAGDSADALHQFHNAVKKFRYTLELFAPLYGPALRGWLERVKNVHALAGDIDGASAVRKFFGQDVEAKLEKKQRKQVEEFVRLWTEGFASPDDARRWIHYLQRSAGKPQTAKRPMARSASASGTLGRRSRRA